MSGFAQLLEKIVSGDELAKAKSLCITHTASKKTDMKKGVEGRLAAIPSPAAYCKFCTKLMLHTVAWMPWLVRCTETGTSYYRIDDSAEPALAAAMQKARAAMVSAMSAASSLRPVPRQTPITAQQRQLLDALDATGFCTSVWEWPALDGIVQAGLDALRQHD